MIWRTSQNVSWNKCSTTSWLRRASYARMCYICNGRGESKMRGKAPLQVQSEDTQYQDCLASAYLWELPCWCRCTFVICLIFSCSWMCYQSSSHNAHWSVWVNYSISKIMTYLGEVSRDYHVWQCSMFQVRFMVMKDYSLVTIYW